MQPYQRSKKMIRALQVGQRIWASIEEVISDERLIIEYDGDLLSVRNETNLVMKVNARIQLQVVAAAPLEFRVIAPVSGRSFNSRSHLDVEI